MTEAKSGDVVHIHYVGTLKDGTEFDSSRDRDPLTFELGSGHIIPGLDSHIQGMKLGDISQVTIPPTEAYGLPNPDHVQVVPRDAMPDNVEIKVGLELSATAPSGNPIPMRVVAMNEESVTVDANHPLAGQTLTFDVELVKIGL